MPRERCPTAGPHGHHTPGPHCAEKVSVLVYLNGEDIDNGSVINAENSGSMALNLQFSSSVKLNPMIDDDLKNASAGGN